MKRENRICVAYGIRLPAAGRNEKKSAADSVRLELLAHEESTPKYVAILSGIAFFFSRL